MSKVDSLVKEFLALKKIAVVGVSEKRDTGCNSNYKKFKDSGYEVYAINPHIQSFHGDPCYPDLKSLPVKVDGVFILASPLVTEQVVKDCVELGIQHVWMHCMMGVRPGSAGGLTSVSPAAVEMCRRNGISVIPGTCPNQFLHADPGHAIMRGLWRLVGNLNMN